jgi:hypothetical protein
MFELLFGETEGKIRWESFRIAPYGLVQRALELPRFRGQFVVLVC